MTAVTIRAMTIADMADVDCIQRQCYTGLEPESVRSLAAKLNASPASCFVAESLGQLAAYVIAVPAVAGQVPALNADYYVLPEQPDCLYLHDLAVSPAARGTGAGTLLVKQVLQAAASAGFTQMALIAVQGSVSYWQRYGFEVCEAGVELQVKLRSYGDDVHYMQRNSLPV